MNSGSIKWPTVLKEDRPSLGRLAVAKAHGLEPISWLFHLYDGPWLFLITGTAPVLAWFSFGRAAAKAAHDREEVTQGALA
jgi:hypothetical protein